MRPTFIVGSITPRLAQILLAVILGVTAALFVSGYWLIDLFPVDSRLLLAVTALAGAAAATAYYYAIRKVGRAAGSARIWKALRLVLLGAPIAGFLFFGGTSEWQEPGRYVGFLLPRQQFKLISSSAPTGAAIVWINSSLGDISYDTLKYDGWDRRADQLILRDPVHNSMEWRGRTGERMELVFTSPEGGDFQIRWGDLEERIHLSPGKASYERIFDVPFAASRTFVLALGFMHFWLLSVVGLWGAGESIVRISRIAHAKGDSSTNREDIRSELPVLGAIMFLALLLRVFNLGVVYPAVDEYYHLIAATQLLNGAQLSSVYPRGLWIVTIPVAAALGVLGHKVWVARAIGVLFNVLALIPLYVLVRKVSKPAAITAGVLYASSPWIITFARVAREYAYYPLYFYLIALGMVSLIEAIPASFVAVRQWRTLLRPRVLLLALGLLVPPVFALRIDWLSTFRTILIAYVVFGAFVLMRFDWRAKSNWPILGMAAIALAWCAWYFYHEQLTKLLLLPRVNPVPLNYFFPNPPQQWYFDRAGLVVATAVVIGGMAALAARRRTVVPLLLLSLFGVYLAVFALFSRTFFHTRHLVSTQLWYVGLVGIGLCWLWEWLRGLMPWKGAATGPVLALGLALMILNPAQVLLPTLSRDPDMPISEDYLHDMSAVQAYMVNHVAEGDALISTVYGLYATWEGTPRFGEQYRINSGTTAEEIAALVRKHDAGWIVIDTIRLEASEITKRSLTDMPQMEYIGSFGDESVWRWGRPLAGSPASEF